MKTVLLLTLLTFGISNFNSQILFTQDFEGPISGTYSTNIWYANYNQIDQNVEGNSPHGGYGMYDFRISSDTPKHIYSPQFSKPNTPYFVSYWINKYDFYTDLNVDFMEKPYPQYQGNSLIAFSLPQLTQDQWTFVEHAIPAGYNQEPTYFIKWEGSGSFLIDDINISNGSIVGINKYDLEKLIKIYPNPSNEGEINLVFAKNMDNVIINLTDALGRNVISKIISVSSNQKITFSTENLQKGLYFISIIKDDSNYTQKVVIK